MKEVTCSSTSKRTRKGEFFEEVTHLTEHGPSTFLIHVDEVEVNIVVRVTLRAHTHPQAHTHACTHTHQKKTQECPKLIAASKMTK